MSQQMKKYLSNPVILCVPSQVFYAFSTRRMLELQNVLARLSVHRPNNFGICTSLIMHLIRCVCHNPIPMVPHLTKALKDLGAAETIARFGMFFLHALDLSLSSIVGIDQDDTQACEQYYGKHRPRTSKAKLGNPFVLNDNNPIDAELYPLGKETTWSQWKEAMSRDPASLMRPCVWESDWASQQDPDAQKLFIAFTRDYWSTLKTEALRISRGPTPDTLQAAMEVWSVTSVQHTAVSTNFVACNAGLNGIFLGGRHAGFLEHARLFFPDPSDDDESSQLKWFIRYGYLKTFFSLCEEGLHTRDRILQGLNNIFTRIQCLPDGLPTRLWRVTDQGINFMTNSDFYKLERIVNTSSAANKRRPARVKVGEATMILRLNGLQEEKNPTAIPITRDMKSKNKARSNRAKNARKPPITRHNGAPVVAPVEITVGCAARNILPLPKRGLRSQTQIAHKEIFLESDEDDENNHDERGQD